MADVANILSQAKRVEVFPIGAADQLLCNQGARIAITTPSVTARSENVAHFLYRYNTVLDVANEGSVPSADGNIFDHQIIAGHGSWSGFDVGGEVVPFRILKSSTALVSICSEMQPINGPLNLKQVGASERFGALCDRLLAAGVKSLVFAMGEIPDFTGLAYDCCYVYFLRAGYDPELVPRLALWALYAREWPPGLAELLDLAMRTHLAPILANKIASTAGDSDGNMGFLQATHASTPFITDGEFQRIKSVAQYIQPADAKQWVAQELQVTILKTWSGLKTVNAVPPEELERLYKALHKTTLF